MKVLQKTKGFRICINLAFGIVIGIICGLCGVAFSKTVGFVTELRLQNSWILYLLPIGGLISAGIYKLCRVKNVGTTNVFDCVRTEQNLPIGLPVAIFCGTAISHLFGASVGREGAALQIGGGVANIFSHTFHLDEDSRHIIIMCGMSGLFSALFGTPLAACVFVLEVIMTRLCLSAAIPVLLSSITAYGISLVFNIGAEKFNMGNLPLLSFSLIWKTAVITTVGIIVAFVFCKGLAVGKTIFKKVVKNEYLRIALGGAVIVILTLVVGNRDYNGGGIEIIEHVFEGNVRYEAFAMKTLFTVICVSCGFKGGEIIPTLFIGATLGGALAAVLSLPLSIGAAIGMAVLFVCATKCPIATILLCCEMFGFYCAPLMIPIVIVSFIIARYKGLYSNNLDIINQIKNKFAK